MQALVNTMLDAAIQTVTDGEGRTIVHSDREAHYRWPGWLTRISDAKPVRSMSRKGCSRDNAACEGLFGRLKTELFHPHDWMTITIVQFVREVDAYIRWYNEKHIKYHRAYAVRSVSRKPRPNRIDSSNFFSASPMVQILQKSNTSAEQQPMVKFAVAKRQAT